MSYLTYVPSYQGEEIYISNEYVKSDIQIDNLTDLDIFLQDFLQDFCIKNKLNSINISFNQTVKIAKCNFVTPKLTEIDAVGLISVTFDFDLQAITNITITTLNEKYTKYKSISILNINEILEKIISNTKLQDEINIIFYLEDFSIIITNTEKKSEILNLNWCFGKYYINNLN